MLYKNSTVKNILSVLVLISLMMGISACNMNKTPTGSSSSTEKITSYEQLKSILEKDYVSSAVSKKETSGFWNNILAAFTNGATNISSKSQSVSGESAASISADADRGNIAPASESGSSNMQAADSNHSNTNVQVQGVDEGDVVKNDGKYIYKVGIDNVDIIKAWPANEMEKISQIKYENGSFSPIEAYVSENRLVVTGAVQRQPAIEQCYWAVRIIVYDTSDKRNPRLLKSAEIEGINLASRLIGDTLYVITNRPVYYNLLEKCGDEGVLPAWSINDKNGYRTIDYKDIEYLPEGNANNYMIIASMNIQNSDKNLTSKAYLGAGVAVYMSLENLYISVVPQDNSYRPVNNVKVVPPKTSDVDPVPDRGDSDVKVVPPVQPAAVDSRDTGSETESSFEPKSKPEIRSEPNDSSASGSGSTAPGSSGSSGSGSGSAVSSSGISTADTPDVDAPVLVSGPSLPDDLTPVSDNQTKPSVISTTAPISAPVVRVPAPAMPIMPFIGGSKTVIYKIPLDNGNLGEALAGEVKGAIINQFSMDEYAGHFRIATTDSDWHSGKGGNNLYVLNAEMKVTGKIEGVAKGERIYSVRFMGAKGYMVTFKTVDPLFAMDLSNPSDPKITGLLKIPGYSEYLHPYDNTHLIGFGKDAVEMTINGGRANTDIAVEENTGSTISSSGVSSPAGIAYYLGMKVSMFDVADMENPKEIFTELIGDRGTTSELLTNHKALLFSKDKNLLAFPVSLYMVSDEAKGIEYAGVPPYGTFAMQGMWVYSLDLVNGFKFKGAITHSNNNNGSAAEDKEFYTPYRYEDNTTSIKRAVYINDVIYTLSEKYIKANKVSDLTEIAAISLK